MYVQNYSFYPHEIDEMPVYVTSIRDVRLEIEMKLKLTSWELTSIDSQLPEGRWFFS